MLRGGGVARKNPPEVASQSLQRQLTIWSCTSITEGKELVCSTQSIPVLFLKPYCWRNVVNTSFRWPVKSLRKFESWEPISRKSYALKTLSANLHFRFLEFTQSNWNFLLYSYAEHKRIWEIHFPVSGSHRPLTIFCKYP